jgi:hypothetical protein
MAMLKRFVLNLAPGGLESIALSSLDVLLGDIRRRISLRRTSRAERESCGTALQAHYDSISTFELRSRIAF